MKLLRPAGPPMTFAPLGRTYRVIAPRKPKASKNTHLDWLLQVIANVGENIQGEYGDLREALWEEIAFVWKWIKKHYVSIPHNDEKWYRAAQTLKTRVHQIRARSPAGR